MSIFPQNICGFGKWFIPLIVLPLSRGSPALLHSVCIGSLTGPGKAELAPGPFNSILRSIDLNLAMSVASKQPTVARAVGGGFPPKGGVQQSWWRLAPGFIFPVPGEAGQGQGSHVSELISTRIPSLCSKQRRE